VEKELPANFTPRGCADVGGSEVCIFARGGSCAADAAASFAINDVLARTGL
jgi:GPI mannosyltransferase 3